MSTAVIQHEAIGIAQVSYSVREFFRSVERDVTMAILHAYFDDSGDPRHEQYMAVGGLIGTDQQFTDLDIMWGSATYDLKEPFRSTECETQHGQFEEWDKKDCDALMRRLVEIIYQTRLHGFGSIVPVAEYRRVFPGAKEYDPYFLALRHTLINVAYIGAVRNSDRAGIIDIRTVCEDSEATSNAAKRVYDELKSFDGWIWKKALAGFSTASKKLMALQASDMIAREAYKHAANIGIRKTRKPVKALHRNVSFHLWTRDALEYLRDAGGPNSLLALTTWGQTGVNPPQMSRFWGPTFDLS